ncbi:MAG: type II toxin-antitoxin system death-on-curing family toxin [Desertifilum sp.]|nr:type II toxin-antitoxin system death-on-curing family toxin [Desertifilum sp.]
MRYLTLDEVLRLHQQVIEQTGGIKGLRDRGILESAIAQPKMTFGGEDLYPRLVDKAAALGFSLTMNHPFIDGNKRTAHAAMEVFLVLNGYEINASLDEQESAMLRLAEGSLNREAFVGWLEQHLQLRN